MIYIMHNGDCTAAFGMVFYKTLLFTESGMSVCVYSMSMDVFLLVCVHAFVYVYVRTKRLHDTTFEGSGSYKQSDFSSQASLTLN